MSHPMQPLFVDDDRKVRFRSNRIIEWLWETGRLDLNEIAMLPFPQEDYVQLAQLIGYSVDGFHELSYVPDAIALEASRQAAELGFENCGCRAQGCKIHCGVKEEQSQ